MLLYMAVSITAHNLQGKKSNGDLHNFTIAFMHLIHLLGLKSFSSLQFWHKEIVPFF